MKKITILLFSLIALTDYAQLAKGRIMLGGSFNYYGNYSNRTDTNTEVLNYKNTNFSGSLRCGYFVTDNIMVGISGGYQNNVAKNESGYPRGNNFFNTQSINSQTYSEAVFSRYYKMIGKSKFALFGQINASYGNGTGISRYVYTSAGNSADIKETQTKVTTVGASFNIGIVYFATKKLGLETSFGNIGFYSTKNKSFYNNTLIDETGNSSFNSTVNLSFTSLFVGVYFYFGRNSINKTEPVTN